MQLKPYILSILFLLPIAACEKNKLQGENIASVNDVGISLTEFQKDISILSKRNPAVKITPHTLEEQLNTVIDKKLLLQEAMKKGLTEDPRFAETIKTFWEQTLIRELMELKIKEWADRLFVTEDEIERHYQRMQYLPTVKLVEIKNKEQAKETKEKMLKGLKINGAESLGPLYLEDIRSDALLNAFDMNAGEANIYEGDSGYVVIHIIKKEKKPIPPLKDIYSRIKTFLLEQKKQKAMEEWLKNLKNSAKIQINTSLLKGLANGK